MHIERNAPTKRWAFYEETHIGKIRNFFSEMKQMKNFLFLFPTACIFGFYKNMNHLITFNFCLINL